LLALRALISSDSVTADYDQFEHSFLARQHPHRQRTPRRQPRSLRRHQ